MDVPDLNPLDADAVDALVAQGAAVRRVLLVGGGAASDAVREIAPVVFGHPVSVPPPDEYVARGAARQAAWVLAAAESSGSPGSSGPPSIYDSQEAVRTGVALFDLFLTSSDPRQARFLRGLGLIPPSGVSLPRSSPPWRGWPRPRSDAAPTVGPPAPPACG